ncbi:DeoR/GlpR family DNA-binding transcription regulator [Gorillibacterium sp. sgz5001074]|uniref:DeoR/GlpR family DNA-binding transcription regulator n=1 Tax=Gorillibacterium sp. sgz5001074 TaxID=3446695 RepID=UPI003F674C16
MSAIKRHEQILEILITDKEATVARLSEALNVSGKTIREDLEKLEQQGLLKRYHGGATLANEGFAGLFPNALPNSKNEDAKAVAAKRALELVKAGEVIALDGGSTTLAMARLMENMPVTVITNDLFIIGELVRKDQVRLVVPGGYRNRNQLINENFSSIIGSMNIQKAFISTTGINPEYGLTVFTQALVSQKRAIMQAAAESYCVADHTKFNQCALLTFAKLEEVAAIITDPGIPAEAVQAYSQRGIQLIR